MILNQFPHRRGIHCASSSLTAVCHYYGIDWSEPMVFGLGAGLGAAYRESSSFPTRVFIGRSPSLEADFFRSVEMDFAWRSGPALPWNRITDSIGRLHPVLAVADLRFLDYYDTVSLFGGHTLVLVGWDPDKQTVFVSDCNCPNIVTISLASLRKALMSQSPLLSGHFAPNQWAEVEMEGPPVLERVLPEALRRNAVSMIAPGRAHFGVRAIRRLADDLQTWGSLREWRKLCLLFYEFAERRGSGGAAFRAIYASFLQEASRYLPELVAIAAASRMQAIAERWHCLSESLMNAVREQSPSLLPEAALQAAAIADHEQSLFTDLLGVLQ